jgi:ADP-ribose pyrophosphatase YjhB (NUDIX family)
VTGAPKGHPAHEASTIAGHAFCPACGTHLEAGAGPGGRPACPRCGFVRYDDPKVATGVIAERDGQILLVRRNHEPMLGRWSFPSGFVDAGEAVSEAAVREVREETNVEVHIDRLLGVYSRPGETVVFIAYAGSIVDGTPAPGDEAFEVGLFSPDALPELAFPHDEDIVAAWRNADGGSRSGAERGR